MPADSNTPSEVSVVIATPHAGDVSPYWIDAFIGLEKPVQPDGSSGGWARVSCVRQEVAVARNLLVRMFLQDTAGTHLLFWDDDVLPPPDGLMRLLADDAPIVSGFYTSRMPPVQPIAYRRLPGPRTQHKYQPVAPAADQFTGVFEADGVGCGFLLIRREVFTRVKQPWFQFTCSRGARGETVSEDLYFCERAKAAGYRILVDARVSCGHVGRYIYDDGDLPQHAPITATASGR